MKLQAPYLRTLFWECTLRCNMSCLHCGSDCLKTESTPDMPLDHFLPVLDEIRQHQSLPCAVHTIGGEPLVRKDILRVGYEITRRGFFWAMVSNARLINAESMRLLSKYGLRSLAIDIDGMADTHNWLRNDPTAFDHAYNAIAHIRRAPNLVWDVITCVNPRNLSQLDEIKRMLIDAGVKKWRCFTITPMGRADRNRFLQLDDSQLRALMLFIARTREEGKINISYACEGYLGEEFERRVRPTHFNCIAGKLVGSVRANGDISGCLSIRSSFAQGNIYRDSFWDVWTNRFQKFRDREWLRTGQCADCEVFDKCQGNGLHLRRDDGSLMTCHYHRLKSNQPI